MKYFIVILFLTVFTGCGSATVPVETVACDGTTVANTYVRCIACNGVMYCDNCLTKDQLVCPPTVPIQRQI